jgi:hypothetical protein
VSTNKQANKLCSLLPSYSILFRADKRIIFWRKRYCSAQWCGCLYFCQRRHHISCVPRTCFLKQLLSFLYFISSICLRAENTASYKINIFSSDDSFIFCNKGEKQSCVHACASRNKKCQCWEKLCTDAAGAFRAIEDRCKKKAPYCEIRARMLSMASHAIQKLLKILY